MSGAADRLLPRPRSLRETGERLAVHRTPELAIRGGHPAAGPALQRVEDALADAGFRLPAAPAGAGPRLTLAIADDGRLPAQGYRLRVAADGIELLGADPAGLFYAATTFAQWLGLHAEAPGRLALPTVEIEDAPDFAQRGVLLDISRNKVPTMKTLFDLVDRLASWKINQLQLYTEHTFAYAGHETVWRDASPMTPAEVRELDRYCAARFVELVPNQNSFGHFHRWLRHPEYRRLAECPDGLEHPFSNRLEPFSLCPLEPGTLELLGDLYDQLLPCFVSRQLNVGADETFDLGQGRSAAACAERGTGRIYLEFLRQIHRLARDRGHRIQFWGDVILEHPELVPELPDDAIALAWGYEADHPFAEQVARFAAAGLDFYVCPGTSSWMSFAGRAHNALLNLASAATAGRAAGAAGYLVTDWGDKGHLQPLSASTFGLLAGAAFAWNAATAAEPQAAPWDDLLDRWGFSCDGLGGIALELGNAYRDTDTVLRNSSVLFHLVTRAQEDLRHERYGRLHRPGLERALERIAGAGAALETDRGPAARCAPVEAELRWVAAILAWACRFGIARLALGRDRPASELPPDERRELRRQLADLIDEAQEIWLARHRPGGLDDSLAVLQRAEEALR